MGAAAEVEELALGLAPVQASEEVAYVVQPVGVPKDLCQGLFEDVAGREVAVLRRLGVGEFRGEQDGPSLRILDTVDTGS